MGRRRGGSLVLGWRQALRSVLAAGPDSFSQFTFTPTLTVPLVGTPYTNIRTLTKSTI